MNKFVWRDKLGNHVIVGDIGLVAEKRREIQDWQGEQARPKR